MKDPSRGDMLRVKLGSIYHFGIYVSDDEVIQFGLAPSRRTLLRDSEVEVLASDIDTFLSGGDLEVCEFDRKEKKKLRSPDEVISYARSKIGTKGYNILYNNCEHFANECMSGEHISLQADAVREIMRNIPVVDVYIAALPDSDIGEMPSCRIRRKDIEKTNNPEVKKEKYFVWKLLEYGLNNSFGIRIGDLTFKKTESGRYYTDKVEFSLSHSKNALAVALSRTPVGVDIEGLDGTHHEALARRSMTDEEYRIYEQLPESERHSYFIKLWTAKEALFKSFHSERFSPSEQDTAIGSYKTFEKEVNGSTFALSVATDTPEKIRFFDNIKL